MQFRMMLQPFHQTEAVAIWQSDVKNHETGSKRSTELERCLPRAGMQDMYSGTFEGGADDARKIEIIFNEQDFGPSLLPVQN